MGECGLIGLCFFGGRCGIGIGCDGYSDGAEGRLWPE